MFKLTPACTGYRKRFGATALLAVLISARLAAQTDSSAAVGAPAPTPPADASAPTPAPTPSTAQVESEPVVKLDTYTVTTDIGAYHEETSSMATKIPTDLKDLSSSLQILNQTAISDRNANSLQDVFGYLTGVSQSQTNINGFTFRGLPVSGSYDQNIEFDGLQGTPLKKSAQSAADVADLEFLKGPNSVLYGQMHPGGLMNIVSKSPEDVQFVDLRATYFTYAGSFNGPLNKNGGSFSLDATGPIDAGGHLLYRLIVDVEDNPPSRPGDFDKLLSIFPSLTYKWTKETYLTVKLESDQDYRRQDDGVFPVFTGPLINTPTGTKSAAYGETAYYYTAPLNTVYQNTYDYGRDKGDALSAFFHTVIGPWTIRLQTRSVWHADYTQEDTQNSTTVFLPKATYATPGTTISRQYNLVINGHRWNSFDYNMFAKFGPEQFQNTIILGAGGGTEQFDNQRYAFGPNTLPALTILHPIINQPSTTNGLQYPANGTKMQDVNNYSTTMGYYFSDQMKIFERLHLTYGVRRDQYVQAGYDLLNLATSPYQSEVIRATDEQLGLVFDITRNVSAYTSWSQSTTPNTVTDVNAQGQSGFAPESGTQYENGLKFESIDGKLFASLCYYYIDRTNVLVAQNGITIPATGQAIYRLDGGQHSEGTELELEYHPIPNWQIQIGGSWGKAFVAQSVQNPYTMGDDLANAPRVSGNFWSRYNFTNTQLKGLGIGLGVIYQGKYWAGDPTTTTYFPISGYTRVDMAFYYKWKGINFAVNIQNLGDRRYLQSEQSAEYIVPGEQRKITFSVERKF
jgi:iron complex outermembrane receptor protein